MFFPYNNIVQTSILSFNSLQQPTYLKKDEHLFHHTVLLFIRSSCLPIHLNVPHCKHSQALRLCGCKEMWGATVCAEEYTIFFSSTKWQTAWHLAFAQCKYVCMADMWATSHLRRQQRTVLPWNILAGPLVKVHPLTSVYVVLTFQPCLAVTIISLSSPRAEGKT